VSPKRLGVTVKRLRQKRGLTQAELAKRAKLHRIYVAQIEAQTKTPSIAALERIAKVLRVTVGDLLE
jgi:transcriptional regulator with XRE-family HTH domain